MTWVYEQNFNELTAGDLNGQDSWSGDTVFDVQSSDTFEGAQAISSVNNADLSKTITRSITGISAGTVYISFKLNRTAGTRRGGIYLRSSGTDVARIFFYNDGTNKKAQLLASSGWIEIEANLQNDTWYRLGIDFDDASQDNKYRCNINGGTWTAFYEYSGSPSWTSIDSIKLEDLGNNGSGTGTIYFDDISPNYISSSGSDIKSHSTLKNNLVSYWDLEEASGTRYDLHGSNDLADYNTVTSATGKIGNCAEFTAANSEALNAGDFATFSAFSVSIWVNPDRVDTTETIFHKADDSTNSEFRLLMLSTGNFQWSIGNGTVYGTNKQVAHGMSAGTWYHIVLTFDGSSSAKLYKNGSVLDSDTTSQTIPNGNQDFVIGIRKRDAVYSIPFDGQLDDVGFWTKELTTTEITALYNSGDGLPYYAPADIKNDTALATSLGSFWELNETSGNASDSVGSNTLTANNNTTYTTGKLGNCAIFDGTDDTLSVENASQNPDLSIGSGDMTVTCWAYLDSKAANKSLLSKYSNSNGNREWWVYYDTALDQFGFRVFDSTVNNITVYCTTLGTISTSTWYFISCTVTQSGNITISVNGTARDTLSLSVTTHNGTAVFLMGGQNTAASPDVDLDGRIDEVGFWTRAISVAEERALFGYGTPPVYEATGGTDYPLTASAGSFILTGNATAFQKAWNMAAAVGSFTLTGIAVAFNIGRGYILEVAAGVFTLTGNNTAFSKAVSMIASAGSFTLTGVATILTKGITMAAAVGSFVVSFLTTNLLQKPWGRTGRNTGIWTRSSKNDDE